MPKKVKNTIFQQGKSCGKILCWRDEITEMNRIRIGRIDKKPENRWIV